MKPADRLAATIRREGPVPFDWFMDAALYAADGGFFARGGGAGRGGRDFVTSPEVGPLFGALVARAIDRCWNVLDRPDPFVVVEAGAGCGRLAREVLRAAPSCLPALRYVLVERSASLRAAQHDLLVIEPPGEAIGPYARYEDVPVAVVGAGPVFTALDDLPVLSFEGVVLANELLDNLPFGIAEWDGDAWTEIRVGLADGGDGRPCDAGPVSATGPATLHPAVPTGAVAPRFVEVRVPAARSDVAMLEALTSGFRVPAGARLPIPRGIEAWLDSCGSALTRGFLLLIDYVDGVEGVLTRGPQWLRTYRGHGRGGPVLEDPGSQDVTAEVIAEQVERSARAAGFEVVSEQPQSQWLRDLGIEDLVEEGRRVWRERAHIGDLTAIAARSRVTEAAALTDPEGLGGHRVITLRRPLPLVWTSAEP